MKLSGLTPRIFPAASFIFWKMLRASDNELILSSKSFWKNYDFYFFCKSFISFVVNLGFKNLFRRASVWKACTIAWMARLKVPELMKATYF